MSEAWRYLIFPGFPLFLIPIAMVYLLVEKIVHRRQYGHWPDFEQIGEPSWAMQKCNRCDTSI